MNGFKLLPVLLLFFAACSNEGDPGPVGPQGAPGPQGPQGEQGESAYVFEYDQLNFTAPDYEIMLSLPTNFGVDSDVALVYLYWENAWRQLPQVVMIPNKGMLQYNFDFTKDDVKLFLDADFSLDQLTAIDTDNWLARVVIVPGTFFDSGARINTADYNELKKALNLPDLPNPEQKTARRKVN